MGTTQGESCLEGTFVKTHPFEKRRAQGINILTKYADRIPVIVEKARSADKTVPDVDKKKFLVTRDMTLGQFVFVIRKRLVLAPEKAIFVFINNTIPPTSALMSDIYETHKSADGFLYMVYNGENTFGGDC